MFPRRTKKLILLFSPECQIWHVKGRKITTKEIASVLEVPDTTISNWRTGRKGISIDNKLRPALTKLESYIRKEIPKIEKDIDLTELVLDEDEDVYSFGCKIGFEIFETQRVIDQEIYRRGGFLKDIYYEGSHAGRESAEEDLQLLEGCYKVLVNRPEHAAHPAHIVQCTMRVRYILEVRDRLAIRVKMNLPPYISGRKRDHYHEYDGFVGVKPQGLFWFFEERANNITDFFLMTTERPDLAKSAGVSTGSYLTTKRDLEASILTGDVCLHHMKDLPQEEFRNFMHQENKIIEDVEYAAMVSRLLNLSS